MSAHDEIQSAKDSVEAERRQKAAEAHALFLLAANRSMIESDWLAEGYEPLPNADGSLTAPSTLKTVGRWPPPGAQKIRKTS